MNTKQTLNHRFLPNPYQFANFTKKKRVILNLKKSLIKDALTE